MNELITVVVPVYNVENYINKCIDSILDQTYKNLEIILVDDGSEDNSGIICDEYKKKNSNITVIHKVNGGLSDARNAGINIAHGKYIAFIDSDDFIDNRMIEVLYNALKKNNADISICGIQIVKNLKREIKKSEKKGYIETVNQYQAYKNLYNNKAMETVVAWNKLYKIDLFKNIRYPIGKINEDAFVIHHLISKTNKIVYVSDKLYYYIKRKNSIMGKKFNQKRLDVLEAYEDRMKFFKDNNMNELYEKFV